MGTEGTHVGKFALTQASLNCVMNTAVRKFLRDKTAATAIEYGLIAALVAIVIITGVKSVGTKLSTTFSTLSTNLK